MQIQTAGENVGAFIDMMGMATGVAGDRLAPWLEAYFKLRCLEVMEAEEVEEARTRKVKTMPTPAELKAVQEHKKLKAADNPSAPSGQLPSHKGGIETEEAVEVVPAEIVEPQPPQEPPKKVSFPGNGSKTKKEIYARLMKARMDGVSFEKIASQRRDLTGSIVMDMAAAVKVDFKLWDSLSMALRELGY